MSVATDTVADVDKTVTIALRITKDEHRAWLAAAEADGRTLSDWVRRRCTGVVTAAPVIIKPKKARRT